MAERTVIAEARADPQPQSQPASIAVSYNFTSDPSLSRYKVSFNSYLEQHPVVTYKANDYAISGLASGAIVIREPTQRRNGMNAQCADSEPESAVPSGPQAQQPRVLLLRRAATDSMPNLWEVPGGAVDLEDLTLLHGVARELFEEAGLRAAHISAIVGAEVGQVFATRRGLLISKLHFLVHVKFDGDNSEDGGVRLDQNEHSAFCWATEEECSTERVRRSVGTGTQAEEMLDIPFTTAEQKAAVLEGFRVWRRINGLGSAQGQ